MDRNKLRKIVLEELTGRSRPRSRRRKLGLADLLSESSDDELLSLTDGIIITNGFVIETIVATNGKVSKLTTSGEDPNALSPVALAAAAEESEQIKDWEAKQKFGLDPGPHPSQPSPDARITRTGERLGAVSVPLNNPQPRNTTPGTGGSVSTSQEPADREESTDTTAVVSTAQDVAPGPGGNRHSAGDNGGGPAPDRAEAGDGQRPAGEAERQDAVVDTDDGNSDGSDNDDGLNAGSRHDSDDPNAGIDTTANEDQDGREEEERTEQPPSMTSAPVPGQTKTTEEMMQAITVAIRNFNANDGQKSGQATKGKTANESFHRRKLADLLYGNW